jgi:hypothetical protein
MNRVSPEMPRIFEPIAYESLNARQKESYNFQKVSGVLADFGFVTIRLSDDWKGADFLAQHVAGETLRIQLKGRLTFQKKHQDKDLWICFREDEQWFLYPHDELLERVLLETNIGNTESWTAAESYSFPSVSQQLRTLLEPYKLPLRQRPEP